MSLLGCRLLNAACFEIRPSIMKASPYTESHYSDLWSETAFVSDSWPRDPPELTKTKEVCKVDGLRCDRKVS